ncbi:hypothetical protein [Halobacillus litoralis]|uniref:hypothetical protein n=1 Tax=Halobacillus litoralis TaxID=45668 RepID=UPI001CD370DA|nr:hypothetical protein [Halobacillus litoralis]MCA1024284.1 hypothetical protein [Halobacillus litoralis]
MVKKNFKQKFADMLGKYDQTEKEYEKALEDKQEQIIVIQGEIQEKESHVSALHKRKVLNKGSEEDFEKAKSELDKLKEKKAEYHSDMELMQKYKVDDAKIIVESMEADQAEHGEEKKQEYEEIKAEILQAKLQYMESLQELSERYKEYKKPSGVISHLKEKLGIEKAYGGDTYGEIGLIFAGGGEPIAVEVLNPEAHEAIQHENIDSKLKAAVKLKQEQGYLK